MNKLFTPGRIGTLKLDNRIIRSATAERMADGDGRPRSQLKTLYQALVEGGVGLIITGHMYVHPSGKAHPEMTGIYSDELIPSLSELVDAVHNLNGRIAVQINHGGMNCNEETVGEAIAPSSLEPPLSGRSAREMNPEEIAEVIEAFGQAARRAQQTGFDGVQIHAAHGYLISQFLSRYTNQRNDEWGGTLENRMRFLREVCEAVRNQVGDDYCVFIKLGMMDGVDGGLTLDEGVNVIAALEEMDLDGVEISGGIGSKRFVNVRKGIRTEDDEAYFLPLAQKARTETRLPICLVGGMRTRKVMEDVLSSGVADFISMCRPLINDPDFPNQMRLGLREKSGCISSNNCWPEEKGEGISCKCPIEEVTSK